jgi:hypothetical protein
MAKRPPQPVNIGHTSAREHFFLNAEPAHSKFKEIQTRENAVACAKAIWELRDYHWRDTNPGIDSRDAQEGFKRFTDDLFEASPDLDLVRDIAEGAKHGGQLGRPSVRVKGIVGAETHGGTTMVSGPPLTPSGPFRGMHEIKPECTLRIVLTDGSEKNLPTVLAASMQYWRGKLLKLVDPPDAA